MDFLPFTRPTIDEATIAGVEVYRPTGAIDTADREMAPRLETLGGKCIACGIVRIQFVPKGEAQVDQVQ